MQPFWETRAIYVVRSGSHAYGTNVPGSDEDTRGVCIPPAEYILGLKHWEQHGDKERDRVIYSLHKFVHLALACNPNIIELLHVREADILHTTDSGRLLRAAAPLFLSKRVFKTFGGYAVAQLKKVHQGKTARHGSHVGLVETFGFDVKNSLHLIRLLRMGIEILSTRQVNTYRPDREELLAIRRGEWPLDKVLSEAERLDQALVEAAQDSDLPEEPDVVTVNELVMQMTRAALEGQL